MKSWALTALVLGSMLTRCTFGIDTTGLAGDGAVDAADESAPQDDGDAPDAADESTPPDDGSSE